MSGRLSAVLILLLAALGFSPPAAAELVTELVTLSPSGVTVRYLAVHGVKPAAAVILFAGGNGQLKLGADGTIGALSLNFLVRSRTKFAEQGLFVAVVDAPGRLPLNGAIRTSPGYAQTISDVILDVRKRSGGAPVWLVGTSSGTLSAAGVAGHLPLQAAAATNLKRPNGIVLTSTQSKLAAQCGKTVFDATLSAINVPTYIVTHKSDGCACSPFSGVRKVLDKLTGTRVKDSIPFSGGDPPISKDPCEAMTPHGFLGLDDAVVKAIADWIKAH